MVTRTSVIRTVTLFNPLTVIPFTKKFWNRKKITTIGTIEAIVAAIKVG